MNKTFVIAAALMLILGISIGYWLASLSQDKTEPQKTSASEADKPLFYRHPMNPSVTSPIPVQDEMGMSYVPVYAEDAKKSAEPAGTVRIDPVTVQNIGVRTTMVKKDILSHIVHAAGRVDYDEERIVRLHPKVEGWVETMWIDKTGQEVQFNQELLSIYSPQLVVSQQEYVLALHNLETLKESPIEEIRRGAKELVNSSRERLRLLDVPDHQLQALTQTHNIHKSLHIHSPKSGVVVHIGAREGQFVTPATEIYHIADLSKVWVYADIYEHELPWVETGDLVEMQLMGIPGRTFRGHLDFIYPYAETKTRTIKVRLAFKNPDLLLRPDMFAEVTIYAHKQESALVIPSEAVVRSGIRDKVFVVRSPGKFEPRAITTGLSSDGRVIVLDGLKEGEEIVTSSQFLIDSESRLREATAKMMEPETEQTEVNPLEIEQRPHHHD